MEKQIPDSVHIITDQNLLSQVLINLIKNALESINENPPDRPLIRVHVVEEAGKILIDISNNGEPIPHELRDQIFIPFFTTKPGGSGIGLSLSKQIMLMLGGDIHLHSNERDGTCFCISLPG